MMFYEMILWLQARMESNERGAAAVEYGLLVALIAVLLVVAMTGLKDSVVSAFDAAAKVIGGK